MAMNLTRGLSPEAVWDLLHASVDDRLSIGALIKDRVADDLNFFDSFSRTVEDAELWVSGGDAGTFLPSWGNQVGGPAAHRLATGNAINNDRYIHGDGVIRNKAFSPFEYRKSTVYWESRLKFTSIADISAFFGLLAIVIVDYIEPVGRCAHFFADPIVSANFMCRNYLGAETQTDSGVPLDIGWHTFRMVWEGAVSILFYIDEALVATHATNLPGIPMVTEFLIRTEAAAIKNMDLDYNHVEIY